MLITVDVGNSNMVFAVFEGERLVFVSRVQTAVTRTADEYAVLLLAILQLYQLTPNCIDGGILSSVVPPVTIPLKQALERLCGIRIIVVGPGVKTGLNIKTDDPGALGADLCCAAVATKAICACPAVFVDLGTITKIMVLDRTGALQGGIFAPGIRISLAAMSENTASLPLITIEDQTAHHAAQRAHWMGRNTIDCMRNGAVFGTAAMVDGVIGQFEREVGECAVVATGGYAEIIRRHSRKQISVHPYLVNEGLRLIYSRLI